MVAIKAHFDGKNIVLPDNFRHGRPGEVLIIFQDSGKDSAEKDAWLKAQEPAFAKVWDNDEDAAYDAL